MNSSKSGDHSDTSEPFDDRTDPHIGLPVERPRLIVVDDDLAMRELLFDRLSAEGYRVSLASSAEEALDLIASGADLQGKPPCELLLTDQRMWGLSGLSMLSEMRAMGWDTPLILMTAFPDISLRRLTGQLGAELLEKPFGLEQLSTLVARLLVSRAVVPPSCR